MRHALAILVTAWIGSPRSFGAVVDAAAQTYPVAAQYSEPYGTDPSFAMMAIAIGFVAAGVWLLLLSARDRD